MAGKSVKPDEKRIRGFVAGVSSARRPYDILNSSKEPVDKPALGPEIFEEYNSTTDG